MDINFPSGGLVFSFQRLHLQALFMLEKKGWSFERTVTLLGNTEFRLPKINLNTCGSPTYCPALCRGAFGVVCCCVELKVTVGKLYSQHKKLLSVNFDLRIDYFQYCVWLASLKI